MTNSKKKRRQNKYSSKKLEDILINFRPENKLGTKLNSFKY